MHLLERNNSSEFSLTKDLFGDDIPKYAILSHTWGTDIEEVTFRPDTWDWQEQGWLQQDLFLWRTGQTQRLTILLGQYLLYQQVK